MTQKSTGATAPRLGIGGARGQTGEEARDSGSVVKRLLRYLTPYRPKLVVVAVFVVLSTLLTLLGPVLFGRAIDSHIIPGDLTGLKKLLLSMLAVYVGAGIIGIIQSVLMVGIGQQLVKDVRSELFGHLQKLSLDFHDHHSTGDLMSRVSNDTEAINQTLSNGLIDFTSNILLFGGIMIAMFVLSWPLALGTVTVLPIMVFLTTRVTNMTRSAFRGVQRHLGRLNGAMEEDISGIRTLQAFAAEKASQARFEATAMDYRRVGVRADIITAALGPMFTTMMTITIALTALLGGWLALRGEVQVGVIATFVIYIMLFFRPMRSIAMLYNQLQSALAGAERIFEVIDTPPTIQDSPDAEPLPDIDGTVVFANVSFAYEPGEAVLSNVSLEAKPGETIALVGPNGAGKTTIISLLSRFYDVTDGQILIDGHDIRSVTQYSIRRQLGIVLQDTFLFSNSVLDNIRYGRLDATDEEVIEAAKLANADRFIRLLPEGYRTLVSEQGHNFSQGQRQLLAIARALLANPRILILDEATSSVDTRTEIQLQEALLRLMKGRTSFVIAHRLGTILKADQVLVVNDRKIIERGTHEVLLAKDGFYADLFYSQYQREPGQLLEGPN
ncbi:MAG: ABC transporter ATP-binding protein/permease [Deinococcales bacterium]|nr:ABC transporter ATP-binding protein/permease [Deinococcales bacterium]